MNTQTFTNAQNITPINDVQIRVLQELSDNDLLGVTGGWGPSRTHKFTDAEFKALEARDHDHGLQSLVVFG